MKYFNTYYIAVALVGIGLFYLYQMDSKADLSFYGFAESSETEINYNYPVIVKSINVQIGQTVKKGDVLLEVVRRKSKEVLIDQGFKIAKLQAEENIWEQKKENEIQNILQKLNLESTDILAKITELEQELDYKKTLTQGLRTIEISKSNYEPLEQEIIHLKDKLQNLKITSEEKTQGIRKEMAKGKKPFDKQIEQLKAEQEFDEAQIEQFILVTAPSDGMIGNISCKEGEHIPSFNTLLSFYEPHSNMIKGYIHEDLTHQVEIGDVYEVSSLKDAFIKYPAKISGLGSRIVEIPSRLRKITEIKTYGREVILAIPDENAFLQKEKVSVYAHTTN